MYRYQVWMQHKWGLRNASPEEIVYTLDQAMLRAKEISKKIVSIGNPFLFINSVYPMVFVLDCCEVPSRVRGISFKGNWKDSVANCNACKNTASNKDDCKLCEGACWSPHRQ